MSEYNDWLDNGPKTNMEPELKAIADDYAALLGVIGDRHIKTKHNIRDFAAKCMQAVRDAKNIQPKANFVHTPDMEPPGMPYSFCSKHGIAFALDGYCRKCEPDGRKTEQTEAAEAAKILEPNLHNSPIAGYQKALVLERSYHLHTKEQLDRVKARVKELESEVERLLEFNKNIVIGALADDRTKVAPSIIERIQNSMRFIHANRDEICKAFIAKFGCEPDECEQVEQKTETGSVWFIRKRGTIPEPINPLPTEAKE